MFAGWLEATGYAPAGSRCHVARATACRCSLRRVRNAAKFGKIVQDPIRLVRMVKKIGGLAANSSDSFLGRAIEVEDSIHVAET